MIGFEKYTLENGLKVIVHTDPSTPVAAVNLLYDVGAKDESPDRTGFAHLFEHLMFEGSLNIPKYDEPLQKAGGENNAFTSNDITNYYLTLPATNLETAFWLESDRMLSLHFSEEKLEIQKNVVCEEFNQVYLNQPYGDAWLMLRPLAYHVHPYQWPTIGKDPAHIRNASLEDVKEFFNRHYCPDRAVLSVAGPVKPDEVFRLAEKWFGPIDRKSNYERNLPKEPDHAEASVKTVHKEVPAHVLYKTFLGLTRLDPGYHAYDMVSDILSNGSSSRFYQKLVKEEKLFSSVSAYQTGDTDRGLFVISGQIMTGVTPEAAEAAVDRELALMVNETVGEREIQKVKNKMVSAFEFSHMNVLNKAMNLAVYENLEDAALLNGEVDKYQSVNAEAIKEISARLFRKEQSAVLYYLSNQR